ncbi:PIG-L deacetylase family protein [Bryobacter aggregatus]|uniref:PIG-L deacetylase family protein n=1 Tax=Bryobacter aggregatus TaxID=360054 RepID=UPI0004E0E8BA|nr:PIG-L family deacetylase [Bryobacter aggregatus]
MRLLCFLLLSTLAMSAQIRVIAFGAHPDDCDIGSAGLAAKFAAMGHKVKFVALTNGDAGHQTTGGGALAKRRRLEAQESGRRLGIEYEVLDNHDGELFPTLDVRLQVIRRIRDWNADIVLSPRSNDYHPDHRNTGLVVQDAAFMVMVPNVAPDTPPLKKNPVFLHYQDRFQKPEPFHPDIAIDITDTFDKKIDALDAHVSQVYEWLPWVGQMPGEVPTNPAERRAWLKKSRTRTITPAIRASLEKWYGKERAARVEHAEAFEVSEYGTQPDEALLRKLFPMVGK